MNLKRLENELNKLGVVIVKELKKALKKKKKKATGKLIQSINYKVTGYKNKVAMRIISKDYLVNVDEGRGEKLTPPPVKAIRKWIDDKAIKPYAKKGLNGKPGKVPTKDQLAIMIAKSIGKKGIKPTNVVLETMIQTQERATYKKIQQVATEDIKDAINQILYDMSTSTKVTRANVKDKYKYKSK
jgi:hypothetical protein